MDQQQERRAEQAKYFEQFASESKDRFQRMLQAARDQIAGIHAAEPESANIDHSLNAPAKQTEPEPEPINNPDIELYQRPRLQLLESADLSKTVLVSPEDLETQKNALQEALDSFAVDAYVSTICRST